MLAGNLRDNGGLQFRGCVRKGELIFSVKANNYLNGIITVPRARFR